METSTRLPAVDSPDGEHSTGAPADYAPAPPRYERRAIRIADIQLWPERPCPRALDHGAVDTLAEDIREHGLLHDPTILDKGDGQPLLAAGLHRLAAARKLGWQTIDCLITDNEALAVELALLENTDRRENSAQEHAEQITELARHWSADHAAKLDRQWRERQETGVAQLGPPARKPGTRKTAKAIGVSRSGLQRAEKIAGITSEAKAEADARGIKTQRDRERIGSEPPEQQMAMVETIAKEREVRQAAKAQAANGAPAGEPPAAKAPAPAKKTKRERLSEPPASAKPDAVGEGIMVRHSIAAYNAAKGEAELTGKSIGEWMDYAILLVAGSGTGLDTIQ